MRRLKVVAGAGVLAFGSVACSSPLQDTQFDYPTYRSVAALNHDSDATVLGTVDSLIGTEVDNGGNPERGAEGQVQGTPLAIYRFKVERVLRGEAPAEMSIAWLNADMLSDDEQISRLKAGQRVVLWVDHLTANDTPGLELADDVWVPLSGDNGVMDVAGDLSTARSNELVALNEEGGSSPLEVTLRALAGVK